MHPRSPQRAYHRSRMSAHPPSAAVWYSRPLSQYPISNVISLGTGDTCGLLGDLPVCISPSAASSASLDPGGQPLQTVSAAGTVGTSPCACNACLYLVSSEPISHGICETRSHYGRIDGGERLGVGCSLARYHFDLYLCSCACPRTWSVVVYRGETQVEVKVFTYLGLEKNMNGEAVYVLLPVAVLLNIEY